MKTLCATVWAGRLSSQASLLYINLGPGSVSVRQIREMCHYSLICFSWYGEVICSGTMFSSRTTWGKLAVKYLLCFSIHARHKLIIASFLTKLVLGLWTTAAKWWVWLERLSITVLRMCWDWEHSCQLWAMFVSADGEPRWPDSIYKCFFSFKKYSFRLSHKNHSWKILSIMKNFKLWELIKWVLIVLNSSEKEVL